MVRMFFVALTIVAFGLFSHVDAHAQASLDLRGNVGGSGIPGGSLIPGFDSAACDSSIQGAIRYNSATSCAEFCNGADWVCPVTANIDETPDVFDFTDNAAAPRNFQIESDIVQITGLPTESGSANLTFDTSISGQGSPEYRICSDGACSSVVTPWTSAAAVISNNEYVQLRTTSNGTAGVAHTVNMTVGASTEDWVVTPISCTGTYTYDYTGSIQTLAIGSGCSVEVELLGAGGANGGTGANSNGGNGGRVVFTFNALSAADLDILVGQRGQTGSASSSYGGGGVGHGQGGGGGGRTEVSFGGTLLAVAGGGGGGGRDDTSATGGDGGDGGINTGQAGSNSSAGASGGGGGSQFSGGAAGGGNAQAGSFGNGGDGAKDQSRDGGSGGGGYYGGGGGQGSSTAGGGGGGGSNYVNTGYGGYVSTTANQRGAGANGSLAWPSGWSGSTGTVNGQGQVVVTLN